MDGSASYRDLEPWRRGGAGAVVANIGVLLPRWAMALSDHRVQNRSPIRPLPLGICRLGDHSNKHWGSCRLSPEDPSRHLFLLG